MRAHLCNRGGHSVSGRIEQLTLNDFRSLFYCMMVSNACICRNRGNTTEIRNGLLIAFAFIAEPKYRWVQQCTLAIALHHEWNADAVQTDMQNQRVTFPALSKFNLNIFSVIAYNEGGWPKQLAMFAYGNARRVSIKIDTNLWAAHMRFSCTPLAYHCTYARKRILLNYTLIAVIHFPTEAIFFSSNLYVGLCHSPAARKPQRLTQNDYF